MAERAERRPPDDDVAQASAPFPSAPPAPVRRRSPASRGASRVRQSGRRAGDLHHVAIAAIRTRRSGAESCRSAALVVLAPRVGDREADVAQAAAGQRRRRGPARRPTFCCSFDSSMSVTRSATPRAVVNFVPATRQQTFEPLRRRDRGSARVPRARRGRRATTAGTTPRWTSVMSASVRSSAGNAWFSSAMKAATSRLGHAGVVRIAGARSDSQVPNSARSRQGTRNRLRPDGDRPPSASSPASRLVTRFIAFSIGMPVDDAERLRADRSTRPPVALTGQRARRSRGCALPSVSRALTPVTRAGRRRRAARSPRHGWPAPRRARRRRARSEKVSRSGSVVT